MGKRRINNLRSLQEIRQDTDGFYGEYIKDAKKKPKTDPVPKRHITEPTEKCSAIITDPGANDLRRCYECECAGPNGCENYLLYAVIRGMCQQPITQPSTAS